ncbi:hypothetical protein H2509_20615 [Stappia sp. F7233]|uniref:Uncharacterized protein n=1 Tax=Stappia albiluteola TaxID=2758565 RepID=A0A839AJB8_9HYPH|nr:hypothetical protein [Stappia albiluteola]MBA5779128.1 hypothetical protein [Stappia albiluteola]MBA5779541.1 hypothetical protein [Stappia albiluteola]
MNRLAEYRKLIAAIVGLVVMILYRRFGVDLMGAETLLVDLIVSGLAAFGVWFVPNDRPAGE